MEELKAMFRVCAHTKSDGNRCGSPALRGGNFCFQHIGGSIRALTRARSTYIGPKLDFLYPGDRQSIQHNLFVVAQAMNDGKLDLPTADTYKRIFASCERNLRGWEAQQRKPGPEKELSPLPDEAPEAAEQHLPHSPTVVIPTEATKGSEAEGPAFSQSSPNPTQSDNPEGVPPNTASDPNAEQAPNAKQPTADEPYADLRHLPSPHYAYAVSKRIDQRYEAESAVKRQEQAAATGGCPMSRF
jgi:hypothetical protein